MFNQKGISHIQTAVIVLVLSMILSAILSYAGMMTILKTARDNAELALDSFVTMNSVEIYDTLKNGGDYTDSLDEAVFQDQIFSIYQLEVSGDTLYARNEEGELIYTMAVPTVDFVFENTLKLRADYIVTIPVIFAGRHITDLQITQKVTSYYNNNLK